MLNCLPWCPLFSCFDYLSYTCTYLSGANYRACPLCSRHSIVSVIKLNFMVHYIYAREITRRELAGLFKCCPPFTYGTTQLFVLNYLQCLMNHDMIRWARTSLSFWSLPPRRDNLLSGLYLYLSQQVLLHSLSRLLR